MIVSRLDDEGRVLWTRLVGAMDSATGLSGPCSPTGGWSVILSVTLDP